MHIIKLDLFYKVENLDFKPKHTWLVFPWFLAILGNNKYLENSELKI